MISIMVFEYEGFAFEPLQCSSMALFRKIVYSITQFEKSGSIVYWVNYFYESSQGKFYLTSFGNLNAHD